MIEYEYLNNGTLVRHFSTLGVKLLQVETGEMYDDPIDTVPCLYTYKETDILAEFDENNYDGEEVFE